MRRRSANSSPARRSSTSYSLTPRSCGRSARSSAPCTRAWAASNPRHSEGLDLKKAILYEHGKAQLEASNYAASVEALTQLARIAPDYQDGTALLRQARGRLVQHHYAEGLRLYRNEKLEEAIAQWRTVLQLDPRHPNAQRNIEQAERILKTLEQRQKR